MISMITEPDFLGKKKTNRGRDLQILEIQKVKDEEWSTVLWEEIEIMG